MSLETWKKIYYPIPADQVPADQAVAHSRQKWYGLRLPVLKEHGVELEHTKKLIHDNNAGLPIDDRSCALCLHYEALGFYCPGCPLAQHLGDICRKPYGAWVTTGDPEPMIAALEACAEKEGPHAP